MKLVGKDGSILLERSEVGPPGTPADRDLLVNITVDTQGFAAADQSWVVDAAWSGFLAELRTLEARRQGHATLESASPRDLRLQFAFAFEPDELPRVLAELERFGRR